MPCSVVNCNEVVYDGSGALKKKQTEEKAKVVAVVWGTEFIQFHALLQIYCTPSMILRKG